MSRVVVQCARRSKIAAAVIDFYFFGYAILVVPIVPLNLTGA